MPVRSYLELVQDDPGQMPRPDPNRPVLIYPTSEIPLNKCRFEPDQLLVTADFLVEKDWSYFNPFELIQENYNQIDQELIGEIYGYQTLWHPVNPSELRLIEESNWSLLPTGIENRPVFYPNVELVDKIRQTTLWAPRHQDDGYEGHIIELDVFVPFFNQYDRNDGTVNQKEIWVPAQDLALFNDRIRRPLRLAQSFRKTTP